MTHRFCRISFSGAHLEEIESKLIPRGVEILDLSKNFLGNLPEEMGTFSRLIELDISDNKFHDLPDNILQRLTKLVTLNASSNLHIELDHPLNLPDLEALKLVKCELDELPDAFARGLPNLKVLDLTGNSLKTLPDSVSELPNLRTMLIGRNNFTHFPNVLKGTKIEHMNISNNVLLDISGIETMKYVQFLDAGSNELQLLPDMDKMIFLKTLMVSNNHIISLSKLPSSLTLLNIGHNLIQCFPDDRTLAWPSLCVIGASKNPLLLSSISKQCLTSSQAIKRHFLTPKCSLCKESPISEIMREMANVNLAQSLQDDMLQLCQSCDGADFAIEFGSGARQVHKAIILSRCPMLTRNQIRASPAIVSFFVEYLYSGSCDLLKSGQIDALLTADKPPRPRSPPAAPRPPDIEFPDFAQNFVNTVRIHSFSITSIQAARAYRPRPVIEKRDRRAAELFFSLIDQLDELLQLSDFCGLDLLKRMIHHRKFYITLLYQQWRVPNTEHLGEFVRTHVVEESSHLQALAVESLHEDLQTCLTSSMPDFEIIVDDTSFPCHEAIITSRCEFFAAMKRTNLIECKKRKAVLHGVDVSSLKTLLQFCYGNTTIPTNLPIEDKFQLFAIADYFGMEDYCWATNQSIVQDIEANPNLLVRCLDLAVQCDSTEMIIICLSHLASNLTGFFCQNAEWRKNVHPMTCEFIDSIKEGNFRLL